MNKSDVSTMLFPYALCAFSLGAFFVYVVHTVRSKRTNSVLAHYALIYYIISFATTSPIGVRLDSR